ncbi:septal ring lytic transglycosylase RlpA family protein [Desulfobacula sp.]|uniref:septal ring lytic transglycosylase RlpA family protein n=1 Tax=Desulfobacula sp. TaxID=2593537 RepID=UPI002613A904|nr:septal ring lytic transglycosylase RlpA family protein [Desulfobacula sp.]
MKNLKIRILCALLGTGLISCATLTTTYNITKGTVAATYDTAKFVTKLGIGTLKMSYKMGTFTFNVISAPLEWPMTSDIESIDGLSPKEAVRQGRVKNSPYVVKGKHYVPMSVAKAATYQEIGTASWYGNETLRQKDGHMTANGEAFDPGKPTAAHKHLPLPIHVKVTNLANNRSIIVRVNDRGPFYGNRIIDLSAGAAKKLGFYSQGTARVKVETVEI